MPTSLAQAAPVVDIHGLGAVGAGHAEHESVLPSGNAEFALWSHVA